MYKLSEFRLWDLCRMCHRITPSAAGHPREFREPWCSPRQKAVVLNTCTVLSYHLPWSGPHPAVLLPFSQALVISR